jgi:hypothetical protein
MRQKRQSVTDDLPRTRDGRSARCAYNTRSQLFADRGEGDALMGTCPKCKLRIRRNGNHVKLGSTWYHKVCPTRRPAKKEKPATAQS